LFSFFFFFFFSVICSFGRLGGAMGVVALVLVMGLLAMACLLAGVADCELLAEQQQQQQRASSRVVVGLLPGGEEDLKSSESRISEEFENWIRHLADGNKEEQNNGGMLAEEKDRPFLHNLRYSEGTKIEGTRKSKTGRSHHVKQAADVVVESIDQLHEKDGADVGVPEQGGGGSWGVNHHLLSPSFYLPFFFC
jgi:hypothetical protein